jgi:ornithine carbamoyltransferase
LAQTIKGASLALKDYLRVSQLTPKDLRLLLDLSVELKRRPHDRRKLLRNEVVTLYFSKPSTRTRVSFTVAVARLGGIPEMLGSNDLQLGRGETIEDTATVISRYAKAFVIRTFADSDVERFAAAAAIPVINALTDGHHPCQALADLLTIREKLGKLKGVRLAYLGDGNNVAHSLMEAGALAGMHVVVASPPGHGVDEGILAWARALAAGSGGSVGTTASAREAAAGADVLYTDVWLSMGDDPDTRAARIEALTPFQVNREIMTLASDRAIFMHCLPAHRGEEVTTDVMDGPRSVVFDQAENRLCTEQAVLVALLRRSLKGEKPASV